MCVNAQGMRQQLEEPKTKTNMYCMHLKGCLELRSKKFVRNKVRMQKISIMSTQIVMQYVT